MDDGLAAELPAVGDGDTFFAAVLATTQRQLTSSLGGMLAVTSASLLVWLLTKAVERLLALARGVLFVTVEVRDRKLSAAVRAWAALHAHSTHRSPGAFFATRSMPSQLLLERAKRAVAAAKDAPARLGNKVRRAVMRAHARLACAPLTRPQLVFPVMRSNVAGPGARSDPTSYAVFEHTPPGPSSGEEESELQQIVWLQKRPVWLHSSLEGGRGSSLLAGAPAPLLRLLDSSGLRELFASAGTRKVTTERESRRRSRSGRERASVFVSALRWQAGTLLRAALQAAFEQSCAEERGLLRVRSVKIVTEDDDPRHRFRELLGGETIVGELIWEKHPPMLARGMRTIVLPAAAEQLRSAAQRFMSPSYKAFCRSKGIAHRAGYALWGPPGCGKTSFVSALAAELGATLYLLYLDGQRMNNASVKKLLRSMTLGRSVLLIEDADAAMPEDFSDAAGANASAGELSRPASVAAGSEATESLQAPTAAEEEADDDDGEDGAEDEEEEEEERDDELGSLLGLGAIPSGSKAKKDKKKKAPGLTLSGLLEALTGPGSPEGCLLFLTTNHIDRLPRQLRQPGVVDAAVEFSLGTVAMIEALFINFYLLSDDNADDDWAVDGSAPPPPRLADATSTGVPANVVKSLAAAFAERCGDRKVGLATVQGHLLDHRDDPQAALNAPFSERRVPGGGVSASASAASSDASAASVGGLAPAESTGDVLMRQRRLMRTLSLQPMPSARSVSSQQHQPDAAASPAPLPLAPQQSVRLRAPRGFTHPAGLDAAEEPRPMLRAAYSVP